MNDVNNILFRCSSLGYIMVEPRTTVAKERGELSETTKTHLVDKYVSEMYGRKEEIQNKFLNKGNEREQDGITLLSRNHKRFYRKNEEHLSNAFIKGTPDLFIGESIHNAEETFDTKCSWSAHTFYRAKFAPLDKLYQYQGHGYMALTKAKKHTVAFCLVNGTMEAIDNEKRILSYQKGMTDAGGNETENFKEKCKQIEINHIFDMESFQKEYPFYEFANDVSKWSYDIPMKDRMFEKVVMRNDAEIERIYKRVQQCREYMRVHLFGEINLKVAA